MYLPAMSSDFRVAHADTQLTLTYPHIAGTASSLLGVIQFGTGAVFGTLVGHLLDGTIWPVAALMGAGGVLCFVAHRVLAPGRTQARPSGQR
ncbi:hypothetical protein FHP25_19015 [Vineibacter terrae]|uniref:MFS transporter n=1 Tax=Vineibacter terrae TaxID=2586908 RepID=A0A5C8PKE6_9HYPH|nr:hypothetical protein [Vineibacter terrae]TXL74009.1 hypothetical protein FHP25_19015 [Vineibacter terrae]